MIPPIAGTFAINKGSIMCFGSHLLCSRIGLFCWVVESWIWHPCCSRAPVGAYQSSHVRHLFLSQPDVVTTALVLYFLETQRHLSGNCCFSGCHFSSVLQYSLYSFFFNFCFNILYFS